MSQEIFNKAADTVKSALKEANKKISNDEALELYGWFKQANEGDNKTDKPGMFSFEGKAKWEAWTSRAGKSKEEAMAQYIQVAKSILEKYGLADKINF